MYPRRVREYDSKASARLPQPVVGPYELTSRLGRAVAGELFLARRSGIERWFALELSDEGLGPAELTRRRHEAERASRVEHPGVVRPVDIGQHHGRLYVVHEHLAGRRLSDEEPLGWREAVRVVTEVADALEAGVRAGVAHPGLDAEHVLLDARDGRARVLGLGAELGPDGARAAVLALARLLCRAAGEPPPLAGGPPPRQLPLEIHGLCQRALEGAGPPTPGGLAAALRGAVEELDVVGSFSTSMGSAGRWSGGPRPARLVAVVGAWSLSLAAAAAWGWWEHDQRLRAQRALFDGEGRLLELQGREAELREEVARLSGALDGERERAGRSEADLHGARAELSRATAAVRAQDEALRRLRVALAEALRGRDPLLDALPIAIDHALDALEPVEEALPVRARLLHNRGRFDECLALIETAERAGEATPGLRLLRARTLHARGESARADELLAELAREPLGVPAARLARALTAPATDSEAAVDLLRTTPALDPLTTAASRILLSQILQQRALARRDADAGQEALRAAEEAVRADPTSFQAYYERSAARYHLWIVTGSRDRSQGPLVIADLVRARALFADPKFWLWAGKSYLEMLDQPAAARVELEEARRRADLQAPDELRATVLAFLGVVHALDGEEEPAANCWREALRIAPEAPSSYSFVPYLPRIDPELRDRVLARLSDADRARIARRAR